MTIPLDESKEVILVGKIEGTEEVIEVCVDPSGKLCISGVAITAIEIFDVKKYIETEQTLVGGTSKKILDTNAVLGGVTDARAHVVFSNDSNFDVYLAMDGAGGDATIGKGKYVRKRGGSYEITNQNMYRGEVHAISAGAAHIAISNGVEP